MKNLLLFIGFLSFLSLTTKAQTKVDSASQGSFLVGLNFSKINMEGENLPSAQAYQYGIAGDRMLTPTFFMGAQLIYAVNKSYFSGSILAKQKGLNFALTPGIKMGDFKLRAGIHFQQNGLITFHSPVENKNSKAIVKKPERIEPTPYIQAAALVGAEFNLSPLLACYVQSSIPFKSTGNSYVGMGLKLKLRKVQINPNTYKKIRKRIASKQIQQLKTGVLMVRLKTSINKIEALKKLGREEEALRVEQNQRAQNLKILHAFRQYYTFSELRFFYSEHSNKVRRGEWKGIFLNEKLEVDSSIEVNNKRIFTVEYTKLEQDTVQFFEDERQVTGGTFDMETQAFYYGGPNVNFAALVVKTQQFEQTSRPFPYYVRCSGPYLNQQPEQYIFGIPLLFYAITPDFKVSVTKLNSRLFEFYTKTISD